jgi:hypothetical protein
MPGFIDIHHLFFPPDLDKASSGWQTPEENLPWTLDLTISTLNSMGTLFYSLFSCISIWRD